MSISTTMSEYESGTYTGHVHPHNGYYAGDFAPQTTCATRRVTAGHRTLMLATCLPRR